MQKWDEGMLSMWNVTEMVRARACVCATEYARACADTVWHEGHSDNKHDESMQLYGGRLKTGGPRLHHVWIVRHIASKD